jgi:PAS domain S-box-containing protein
MDSTQIAKEEYTKELHKLRSEYEDLKAKYQLEIVRNVQSSQADCRNKYYNAILQTTQDGFWIVNRSGVISDVNEAYCKMSGYTREEIIGMAISNIDMDEQPEETKARIERIISYGSEIFETNHRRKDGSILTLEISASYLKESNDFVCFCRDITERKSKHEALIASEQKMRHVFDYSAIGMAFVSPDGKFLKVNSILCNILGYSRSELLERSFQDLTHADDLEADMIAIEKMLNGDIISHKMDKRYYHKLGHIIWVHISFSLYTDINGEPMHFIAQIEDITNNKKAEQALRANEEKYKQLFSFLPFGISITDKAGNLIENNEEAIQLLGLSDEELLRRKISGEVWNIIRLDGSLMPAEEYASVKALKENRRVENVVMGIVRPDKETTWITVTAEPFKYGDYGMVISYLDITKMVIAEKELKQNEFRLKTIINIFQNKSDSLQDFLDHALNRAVEFTESKIGYIYFYDKDKKEFILNSWSNEVMKECTIAEKQRRYELEKTGIWGEAVRQRKPIMVNDFQSPNPFKKGYPEGHAHLEKFLTVPIFSREEIVAVVGVANKETDYNEADVLQLILLMDTVWRTVERKQEDNLKTKLLKEIQASKEELEEALLQKSKLLDELSESEAKLKLNIAAKDKFFSIIAHDLKAPFSGFLGLTDVMAKGYEELTLKEMQQMSKTVNDSANSMFKLLNDLLQWSRTQIGTIKTHKEELDLYEIAYNTVYLMKQNAEAKNIYIDQRIKPDTLVSYDRNMIVTIFRNLISNAIKFSLVGGKIDIGIIDGSNDNNYFTVYIKDTGLGIPEDQLKNIFTIGHTFSRKGTDNESGTGLGLILCREFVEMHGGKIWCESEVGKGSTFYFTLPMG